MGTRDDGADAGRGEGSAPEGAPGDAAGRDDAAGAGRGEGSAPEGAPGDAAGEDHGEPRAASTFPIADEGPPDAETVPPVVAGRYELVRPVGAGGMGRVFEALDRLRGGHRVALKWLHASTRDARARTAREVAALRALNLPGVVRLLDEGTERGHRYLVMEYVEGRPFPGCEVPVRWSRIRNVVAALLETLSLVHGAGFVHRDLKPANVLVRPDGRPVILDFGLARGADSPAMTRPGTPMGTPRYQAPEQALGGPADARADLYAVGVMLFEALAGRRPYDDGVAPVLRARFGRAVPRLRDLAPDVPDAVARVVDRLLQVDPDARFPSAGHVIRALRGEGAIGGLGHELPWVGPRGVLEALEAALRAGRAVDVWGPRGSGRSRHVREALRSVPDRVVHHLRPGSAPFESLVPALGAPPDADAFETVEAEVRARLLARLRARAVVVADPAEGLDRWSAAVLEEVRGAGCVVRTFTEERPGALRVPEVREADLRVLFAGPDRILHLREDAARELYRRTGGHPARFEAELAAWVRAGLARWEGDRLLVPRGELDRLAGWFPALAEPATEPAHLPGALDELLAWVRLAGEHANPRLLAAVSGRPRWRVEAELDELARRGAVARAGDRWEARWPSRALEGWSGEQRRAAHRRLALALPPGSAARLHHVVLARDTGAVVDEVVRYARAAAAVGRVGSAVAAIRASLAVVRAAGDVEGEVALLRELLRVALAAGDWGAYDEVLYELDRASTRRGVDGARRLLLAMRLAAERQFDAVAAHLAEMPREVIEDPDLRAHVHRLRIVVAEREGPEAVAEEVRRAEEWARNGGAEAEALVLNWRAITAYQEQRFEEAFELALASAHLRETVPGRLSSLRNAAAALVELGRYDEAGGIALALRGQAGRLRLPGWEAHGQCLAREVLVRSGSEREPDEALVDLVASLGDLSLFAYAAITEAHHAWRTGHPAAARLAARAERAYRDLGMHLPAATARALALVASGEHAPPQLLEEDWEAALERAPRFQVGLEALALLVRASDPVPAEWRAALARQVESAQLGGRAWRGRGLILSFDEVARLARLG